MDDELSEREQRAYAIIDEALRTYPMQPAPADLMGTVMARLEVRRPARRFRLAWIDYAVSLFAAGMAGLAWLLWPLLPLPPDWPARVQFRMLVWQQHLRYGGPLYETILLAGAGLLTLAGLAAWLKLANGFVREWRQAGWVR